MAKTDASTSDISQKLDLPQWSCRVDGTPKDQAWTVGEIFTLVCEGPSVPLQSDQVALQQDGYPKYALKILDVDNQTQNQLNLQVTSYIPAQHQFEKLFVINQDKKVAQIEPFVLPVKSVIQNPQQKPFGPVSAFKLGWPMWLWVVLALVVGGVALYSIFNMRRRSQMRRVLDELKQHNTALGPFNQFNKDIRLLGRQYVFSDTKGWSEQKKQRYLESLDEVFRMFLLREFYVPALDWNSSAVLKSVSKQDRSRFPAYGDELKKILKELDHAKADADKIQVHDCKQLTQMAKKVSQSIWKVRK